LYFTFRIWVNRFAYRDEQKVVVMFVRFRAPELTACCIFYRDWPPRWRPLAAWVRLAPVTGSQPCQKRFAASSPMFKVGALLLVSSVVSVCGFGGIVLPLLKAHMLGSPRSSL
jgi:hypothetical protein